MKNNLNFKFGICGIICVFALTLFALHAQGQNSTGLDVSNTTPSSKLNTTTEIVSSVPNVTLTKFEILSPNSVGIDIKYSGTGKSPAIKVESSAININSKLEDIVNQLGSLKDNSSGLNLTDSAASMVEQLGQLGDILSSSNGTKSFDAGWKSPKTVIVKLTGNTTLNDAQFIGVEIN